MNDPAQNFQPPDLYEVLIEKANVGVAIHDITEHVKTVFVNDYWQKRTGYSFDDVIRLGERLFFELVHPEDTTVVSEMKDFYSSTEKDHFSGFHRIKTKYGELIWVFASLKVIERKENGTPSKVVSFSFDLSAKIQTHPQIEALLKENISLRKQLVQKTLTKRQMEVLKLIGQGKSDAEISEILFISPFTAKTHRANLRKILCLPNSVSLVKFCYDNGIL